METFSSPTPRESTTLIVCLHIHLNICLGLPILNWVPWFPDSVLLSSLCLLEEQHLLPPSLLSKVRWHQGEKGPLSQASITRVPRTTVLNLCVVTLLGVVEQAFHRALLSGILHIT